MSSSKSPVATEFSVGWAAEGAQQPLKEFKFGLRPLQPEDLHLEITHCGVCHSDLHQILNDWGVAKYPLIAGHEIIGVVTQVGSNTKGFKIGDRVGVGPNVSSCHQCEDCKIGKDNYCSRTLGVYNAKHPSGFMNYGGFSRDIRVDFRYAFKIPDSIPSEIAAPLLCAGQTVFSPLKKYAKPGDVVGILGIGGLGHLAIQYAKAMGCVPVCFSSSPSKEEFAKKLGAADFVDISNREQMSKYRRKLNFLLACHSGGSVNWSQLYSLMKTDAVICLVGLATDKIELMPFQLLRRIPLVGSSLASSSDVKEMLELSAKHKIGPMIEEFPMSQVNSALERVAKNQVRFRCVLKADWNPKPKL